MPDAGNGATRSLLSLASSLREALANFEPSALSGEDCALLAEDLAATQKACAAAGVLAARRAADCSAHRTRGFADANAWLARLSGPRRSRLDRHSRRLPPSVGAHKPRSQRSWARSRCCRPTR